jgi:ethanolamine transporter EutH
VTKDEMIIHGRVHGIGALLGIPTFPIAATLIALSLSSNQAWASAKRSVFWTAMLTWVGLVVFILSIAIMLPRGGGKFTPDVLIGWTNRFLIFTSVVWLLTVARQALELYRQTT